MADRPLVFPAPSAEELIGVLAQGDVAQARARISSRGQAEQIVVVRVQSEQVKLLAGRVAELETRLWEKVEELLQATQQRRPVQAGTKAVLLRG